MNKIVSVYKPLGLTPLETVNLFKKNNPLYLNEKISYAGRLDPMAEGILILLIGEQNKKRKEFEKLDKTYEAEIIFGISTDTFDQMGLIKKINQHNFSDIEIEKAANKFIGKHYQIYPPYSSKTVEGKPLYWWSRNKRLNEIKLPKHKIEIYELKIIEISEINGFDLAESIIKNIKLVTGDFRQEKIIKNWEEFAELNKDIYFQKIKIKISCSSGTYIRRFAEDLGFNLKSSAFALSINRTDVGEYNIKKAIRLDL